MNYNEFGKADFGAGDLDALLQGAGINNVNSFVDDFRNEVDGTVLEENFDWLESAEGTVISPEAFIQYYKVLDRQQPEQTKPTPQVEPKKVTPQVETTNVAPKVEPKKVTPEDNNKNPGKQAAFRSIHKKRRIDTSSAFQFQLRKTPKRLLTLLKSTIEMEMERLLLGISKLS